MATLSDFLTDRTAAGARYAAAIAELRDAYVELAALDLVLMNKRVGYPPPVRTFPGFPPALPQEYRHDVYALNIEEPVNLHTRAEEAAAVKLATFSGG